MDKYTFRRLCLWLRLNTKLTTRYQTVEQSDDIPIHLRLRGAFGEVALFFRIGHSTVSSVFREVIDPMRKLHLAYVIQPDDNDVSLEVELKPKHQEFSGCIGAIYGTHIAAFIPATYRNLF